MAPQIWTLSRRDTEQDLYVRSDGASYWADQKEINKFDPELPSVAQRHFSKGIAAILMARENKNIGKDVVVISKSTARQVLGWMGWLLGLIGFLTVVELVKAW